MPDQEHPTSIRQAEIRDDFKSGRRYREWLAKVKPEQASPSSAIRGIPDGSVPWSETEPNGSVTAFTSPESFLEAFRSPRPLDLRAHIFAHLISSGEVQAPRVFHWKMDPEPRPIENSDLAILRNALDDLLEGPTEMRDMTPAQKEEFARKYGEGAVVIAGFVIKRA